jgi:tetratricopeptide (TPR) repeat protein
MRGPLLTFVWSVIYPFAVAVHAQRGAVADPMSLITSMCSNGASAPWSGLAPASSIAPAGRPFLSPMAETKEAAQALLRLSDVPESATDPDSVMVPRWQGSLSTLEDSRASVSIYHHTLIADRHVVNGDPASALDHLDAALVLDCLNQSLLERAARAAALAGQARRSRLYWDVLANLNVRAPRIQYERVLAECREGRLDAARDHAESALALFPRHAGLRLLNAALSPDASPSRLGYLSVPDMAVLAREWHRCRDSLAFLSPRAYIRIARYLLSGGAPEEVNPASAPESDDAYWARTCALASRYLVDADFALRGHRWDRLLTALDGAEKIGVGGPWMAMFRAETLLQMGDRARGEPLLDAALKRYGKDERVAFDGARLLLDLGRAPEALELFNHVVRQDRSNPEYRFGLACALTAAGQGAAGLVQARALLAEQPGRMAEWLQGDQPYIRDLRERL